MIKKIRKFSANQPKLGKESDNVNESSLCLTGKRTSERDDYVASSKSAIEGSCGLMEAKTRGSGNGFAVPQPKIIPWLASIRICLGLKGQVILRRLERIYRGSSRRREGRTRNAKDLLFRLNVPGVRCAKETVTGTEKDRGERSKQSCWKVRRLSTPERSKSKELVITKGCSLMDFLFAYNLNPSGYVIRRKELALSRTIEFLGHWFS